MIVISSIGYKLWVKLKYYEFWQVLVRGELSYGGGGGGPGGHVPPTICRCPPQKVMPI